MKDFPYDILLKIGRYIEDGADNKSDKINIESKKIKEFDELNHYNLSDEEIMIISICWYDYIVNRQFAIDPLSILTKIYKEPRIQIRKIKIIISLLEKDIFFASKNELFIKVKDHTDSKPLFTYSIEGLLENDIEFHKSFIQVILGVKVETLHCVETAYSDNKDFLKDWFTYASMMYDFSVNSSFNGRVDIRVQSTKKAKYQDMLNWKKHLDIRLKRTTNSFPLMELKKEHKLDDKELIILVHLIKEELEGKECDIVELLKLISVDVHEMYINKSYITEKSKLVSRGLIELSEGTFMFSSGLVVKPAPQVIRKVLMEAPISDDEKLEQILKNDNIFTLLEPTQTFDDLILSSTIKKTLGYSLNQYISNVSSVLNKWGLYDKGIFSTNKITKKIEPALLMLFYGVPGTGKTFAAGAIANALGKKLLVTDISRIQSKWVGESEKNVRQIFSLFEQITNSVDNPPVLLLNEADQFLSKRNNNATTSVDKMNNSMQNLFLEAFENLNGVLIATTNLRSNFDDAFSRRFNLKLDFPMPKLSERKALWDLHLPPSIPGVNNIDTNMLSKEYELSGGQIKVIVNNACVEAASRNGYLQKLLQKDLEKYCKLEIDSFFYKKSKIGFNS